MNLLQDVRYAGRVLGKSPGFAATAVITIGLGIGACTSMFSVSDALLWKPVPLPNLDRLATVIERSNNPDDWNALSPGDFDDLKRDSVSFEGFASWGYGGANLVGAGGEPERVGQALVSANFFDVVGVRPAIGRAFQPGEDEPGRERVVILSDNLGKRRSAGTPGTGGRNPVFDAENYPVGGFRPATYQPPLAGDAGTPPAMTPSRRADRDAPPLMTVARLKPGISLEQAGADM